MPIRQPKVYTIKARIWARRNKWLLVMDKESDLLSHIGQRVVVEVLPLVFIEGKLRVEYGHPSIILPACLRRTWRYLWQEAPRQLVVRVIVDSAEGGI